MLKDYDNYINESANNTITAICNVDEVSLLEISGESNIDDALKTQFGWIESIELIDYNKIDDLYEFNISLNSDIFAKTKETNMGDALKSELEWLEQSGIKLEEIK